MFHELTFKTGLDFSASDLRSSRAAFCATDVRAVGAGAKAAADPAKMEIRASFMVVFFVAESRLTPWPWCKAKKQQEQHAPSLEVNLSS